MRFKDTVIGKLFRSLLVNLKKLLRLRASIHEISLGFAVGVFIGILPTFGLGFLVISFFAIFIRFNVIAAFVGTALGNPFLSPFWIFSSYKLGELITGVRIELLDLKINFLNTTLKFTLAFIAGNLVISLVVAIISYFVVYILIDNIKKSRNQKQ